MSERSHRWRNARASPYRRLDDATHKVVLLDTTGSRSACLHDELLELAHRHTRQLCDSILHRLARTRPIALNLDNTAERQLQHRHQDQRPRDPIDPIRALPIPKPNYHPLGGCLQSSTHGSPGCRACCARRRIECSIIRSLAGRNSARKSLRAIQNALMAALMASRMRDGLFGSPLSQRG